MTWSLRYTKQALDDLADIWDYIAPDNPVAADKLTTDILKCFDKTADFPLIGRAADEIVASHRILTHGHYVLIYCVYEDEHVVELVRVVHGARDWPSLFS